MTDALDPKEILYDENMLDQLEAGAKAVHDAVGRTMGPSGQLVMYEDNVDNPYPTVTKDGVSVASMIAFDEQAKNMGAQFVIQSAREQVHETGDGTTLTSIMTYKLFKEGRKMITTGFSTNEIIAGMKQAIEDTVSHIKDISIKKVGLEALKDIARVATNNDIELAYKIAEAVEKTGKHGMVFKERGHNDKHSVEYETGYQLNIGIQAKEFANVQEKIMMLENPYVLVTDKNIVDAHELLPLLRELKGLVKEKDKPSLVIIAPQIGIEVLQVMKRNITDINGEFFMVHIRPSSDLKPEKNRMIMEDLASITGGIFISQDSGYQIDKLRLEYIGQCEGISSHQEKTLISGYNKEYVKKRMKALQGQRELTKDRYIKALIDESLARLSGGVAKVIVGGKNLTEQTEILARVDDAIRACTSAQEMGYVRGGGVSLLESKKYIESIMTKELKNNLNVGYRLVLDALKYPAEVILKNAKREDWQGIIADILNDNDCNGYDINTGTVRAIASYDSTVTYHDMYELNIIDPAKVIIFALKNAMSASISMLRTSVMIIGKKGVKDA